MNLYISNNLMIISRERVVSILLDEIPNTPTWIFNSFIDELVLRKEREPIFRFEWVDLDFYNKVCNILASIGILGQTYVFGVMGYKTIQELLADGGSIDGMHIEYYNRITMEL